MKVDASSLTKSLLDEEVDSADGPFASRAVREANETTSSLPISEISTATQRNSYGRQYLPGRPLGMRERGLIIEQHQLGMRVKLIARSLGISHGCVSKIISR